MIQRQYDAEIERASLLSDRYPFASEVLAFYRHIAKFQKALSHSLEAALPRGDADTSLAAPLRERIDLTLLLPHVRGFLAVMQEYAPGPLATFARQLHQQSAGSWVADLDRYVAHGHRSGGEDLEPLSELFANAVVRPYAALLAARSPRPPQVAIVHACPLCDSRPLVGALRPEGDGGKRFLLCSFCGNEWEFRRIFCANCGETDEKKLPVYVAEQFPHLRVECCDTCRHFLRTADLTRDGNALPVVDDLAAIPLTLWASEHAYTRIEQNLLGT